METVEFKFQLGVALRDVVTEMSGIAEARRECLNGCIQYMVQPRIRDGKIPEAYWIDEQQLQYDGLGVVDDLEPREGTSGGLRQPASK